MDGWNETNWLECVVLNGSSWSTETGLSRETELDVFVGIEHRMRGEAADQEWNAYAKKGCTYSAADAPDFGRSDNCFFFLIEEEYHWRIMVQDRTKL